MEFYTLPQKFSEFFFSIDDSFAQFMHSIKIMFRSQFQAFGKGSDILYRENEQQFVYSNVKIVSKFMVPKTWRQTPFGNSIEIFWMFWALMETGGGSLEYVQWFGWKWSYFIEMLH